MRMPAWLIVSVVLSTGCTQLAGGRHLDPSFRGDPRAVAGDTARAVRVVSWNIETLGPVGSTEYDAAQQILARLDADVVLLQEIQWEEDVGVIDDFAADAGYPEVHDGWPVSFGTDTQLILSRLPMTWRVLLDGDDLSGDADARDTTRAYPVAGLDVGGVELVVASGHFKAGSGDANAFRRAVDAQRAVQALQPFDPSTDHVLFAGDLNDDLGDASNVPTTWTWQPSGMPSTFALGDDLAVSLGDGGIPNDVFAPFLTAGMQILDAAQLSGSDTTRPWSGRRLDYVIVTPSLAAAAQTEVYDTFDDDGVSGLPKPGPTPTLSTLTAADHLPVVVDLVLPGPQTDPDPTDTGAPIDTGPPPADAVPVADLLPGELMITEVMANPDGCPDDEGEWVELLNRSGSSVDLDGLQLCDAQGCAPVDGAGLVDADAVVVIARTDSACGLPVAGTFTAALSNGGDEVALLGSAELDAVSYPDAAASIPWVFDDDGRCEGTTGGTPGEALACDGSPLVADGAPDASTPSEWTIDDVPPDRLQLTEVMPNPAACSDDEGEWVEVHNTGPEPVDLSGLWLADNQGASLVDTTTVLAADERAVFARSATACDPTVVDGTFPAALSNGGDQVSLQRADGDVLDAMDYPDAPSGEVWVRQTEGWCLSTTPTPGAADAPCAPSEAAE